jgi:hypothetical protein
MLAVFGRAWRQDERKEIVSCETILHCKLSDFSLFSVILW